MSDIGASDQAVRADLASPRFRGGVLRGYWQEVSYAFPILIGTVAAVEPDGKVSRYAFRFELSGFPATAPEAKIWDVTADSLLVLDRRPRGSSRVVEAFKDWGPHSVYRPWERHAGAHNNWNSTYRDLAWHAGRDLTFVLEDLHGLLTSNTASRRDR